MDSKTILSAATSGFPVVGMETSFIVTVLPDPMSSFLRGMQEVIPGIRAVRMFSPVDRMTGLL
jgi:hypothetical protein